MMKKLFTLCSLLLAIASFGQVQLNMPVISNWDNDQLPSYNNISFNEIWGYAAEGGGEYAIMGSLRGTYIFDITGNQATNPAPIGYFTGRDTAANGVNRDYKTYGNYLYGVCDQGNASLQIFDLSGLPAGVVKVSDNQNIVKTCHTIFIDHDRIYFSGSRDSSGTPHALVVASLADPRNPQVISVLDPPAFDYVHAAYVRNDTAYLSCGNLGMFVYDYSDPANPQLIQSFTNYDQQGYNHSAWVSEDGQYLVFTDETHGTGVKLYDISDLSNPILKSIFRSNLLGTVDSLGDAGSIAHNPFIVGRKAFISYYHDGVQVFDFSDPRHPVRCAYFDTDPLNDNYAGYGGAWGVYPFLPSHHILGSDLLNGLYVLDGNDPAVLGAESQTKGRAHSMLVYPNPSSEDFYFSANLNHPADLAIQVFDIEGELVLTQQHALPNGTSTLKISCSNLANGVYFVRTQAANFNFSDKIVLIR